MGLTQVPVPTNGFKTIEEATEWHAKELKGKRFRSQGKVYVVGEYDPETKKVKLYNTKGEYQYSPYFSWVEGIFIDS